MENREAIPVPGQLDGREYRGWRERHPWSQSGNAKQEELEEGAWEKGPGWSEGR